MHCGLLKEWANKVSSVVPSRSSLFFWATRMANCIAVIPARYASARFPGKPLVDIHGKPMVQRVYEAARQCEAFSEVVVATDDERIAEAVRRFGGQVAMTRTDHATGTDRVAEVAAGRVNVDAVANVQGDQPFVTARVLTQLVQPYLDGKNPPMTTIACPLSGEDAFHDANTVKVICDKNMDAIYFSRAPIPYFQQRLDAPVYHHLGLYAFDATFLQTYTQLAPTPLERCEQLEQLRVIEHGYRIQVALTEVAFPEVNTPEDLDRAKAILSSSPNQFS